MPERFYVTVGKYKDTHYFLGDYRNLYMLENKICTKIASNIDTNPFSIGIVIDGVFYMSSRNEILKIENGLKTMLSKNTETADVFFMDKILYRKKNDRIYKSIDFGKSWTDVTNQVSFKDGLTVNEFDFKAGYRAFTLNNLRYKINNGYTVSFDGKTLKKVTTNINITNLQSIAIEESCNNYDIKNLILIERIENISYCYRYKWVEVTINEQGNMIFKLIKEQIAFVGSGGFKGFLNDKEKTFTNVSYLDAKENLIVEYFANTYIEDREKG